MTRRVVEWGCVLAVLGCALALAPRPGAARDLGVRGAVWPIAEPDLLAGIEARLRELEESGGLDRLRTEARERARQRIEAPGRVEGIGPARVRRTRLFDPSIEVDRDVRAADGTLIAARGTRLNPLDRMRGLARDLLFVDGTRPVEVSWALRHGRPARIVLVDGRPLELMRIHQRRFFFDQGGRLSRRLGLRATPSVVAAEGPVLRITEVPLEDEEGRADDAAGGARP